MIEKDMENELIQGFKEISQFSDDFDESSKQPFDLENILGIFVGIGLFLGLLLGLSFLFKK